jgi:hypothetical protein
VAEENLEARVAVNESSIRDLQYESRRTRERLHQVESDRRVLQFLVDQVKKLSEQLPDLARRAAIEALKATSDERAEQRDRHFTRFEKRVAFALGLAIAVINLTGYHIH